MEHALALLKKNSYNQVAAMTGISKSTLIRANRANSYLGGCIITKSLYEETSKLKWIFREESANPAVLAIYDMPVGTDLEYDAQRRVFIDSNTGKEYR